MAVSKADLEKCIGLMCEVLTEDNVSLYIGSITHILHTTSEMQIDAAKEGETPGGLIYNTPIKVRVRTAGNTDLLMLILGNVARCTPKFWRISVREIKLLNESRDSFRLRVSRNALVTRWSGTEKPVSCKLLDVSLTGLSFRSTSVYRVEDHLDLSSVQLAEKGDTYSFHCVVRRIQHIHDSSACIYGCSFFHLDGRVERQLSKDIFMLQAQSLKARTNEDDE